MIVKKQSFRSMISRAHPSGIMDGLGNPGCKAPMSCICLLTARRSCNNLYFPDFFFIIKIGVFHGLTDSFKCPWEYCSLTRACAWTRLSLFSGHCSTHTGCSVFHLMGIGKVQAMAVFIKGSRPLSAPFPSVLVCRGRSMPALHLGVVKLTRCR